MFLQRICYGFAGALAALFPTSSNSFTTPTSPLVLSPSPNLHRGLTTSLAASASPNLVVISPPGGIGEITSIEAARLGGSVKWFVVSAPEAESASGTKLALTAETLAAIEKSGGSLDLAGATADSLLASPDEKSGTNSALNAMASWCGSGSSVNSIICTYDGADDEKRRVDQAKSAEQREKGANDELESIRGGIRVAAREAVRSTSGKKIALLAAGDELMEDGEEEEKNGPGFLAGLFGGNGLEVPDSLDEAMEGNTLVIRYGELFGAPESSPESSPFMGGPRRDPIVREMYTLRSVRIDPTVSGGDDGSKSNRLSMGEAASRLGLGKVASFSGMDVSLSSFAGTASPDDEEWITEFARAAEMASSGSGGGARLFAAEFSSVPSTKRLAEWLATKWAPAILRSYDIAGTRVGARPVYALQTEDDTVEIVWQQLVNFESITSGKMIIQVDEKGLTAVRGSGDAKGGFGRISSKPLPGEDILVRRLGDAASQAMSKGLAVKPQMAKKVATVTEPVTTVVAAMATVPAEPAAQDAGPGPRSAGARRSAERNRGSGKRRRATPKSSSDGD